MRGYEKTKQPRPATNMYYVYNVFFFNRDPHLLSIWTAAL
jgi:hypothetical protein